MLWHFSGSSNAISNRHRARRALGLSFLFGGFLMMTLTGCDTEAMLVPDSSDRDTALRILGTDARVMGFVDIEGQMAVSREIMQREADMAEAMDQLKDRVFEATGIQVDQDVHGAYVAIEDLNENAQGALLAFVDFDQEHVTQELESEAEIVRLDTEWPVDAYTAREGADTMAIAFAEGRLVIITTGADRLRALLARAYDESVPAVMDDLMASVADHDTWMVVRGLDELSADMPGENVSGQAALIRPLLTSLQDVAMGIDNDAESIESRFLIRPVASVSVDDYENLLSGVRAMMRLQLRDYDAALDMVNKIEIDARDEWVELSMQADHDELEAMANELREEMRLGWN